MEGIVADFLGVALAQDRLPGGGNRAEAQRVGRQTGQREAAGRIVFGVQQQRPVLEPQQFGFLGWIAVDLLQGSAVGNGAGARSLGRDRILLVLQSQRQDQWPQRQSLDDQRSQHDGEGGKQDDVARRKAFRQREG